MIKIEILVRQIDFGQGFLLFHKVSNFEKIKKLVRRRGIEYIKCEINGHEFIGNFKELEEYLYTTYQKDKS
ncbi:MAG: hypothetical protein RR500_04830 [Bacilli bacterium]